MIKFVNAKINLGLQVLRRRDDGYHELQTIFLPVGRDSGRPGVPAGLCDVLEAVPSDRDSLQVEGADFSGNLADNLVWKALQMWRKSGGIAPMADIRLRKHLPSGAGMGAGSADAAFLLRAMQELAESPLEEDTLQAVATSLGADVPFFLLNKPALGEGIGERLTPISIPALKGKWLALLKPAQGISTAQAFSGITPREGRIPLTELATLPMDEWQGRITNDFEPVMFSTHPDLASIKTHLIKRGAIYASMTGSGSTFYGIFATREQAGEAVQEAEVAWKGVCPCPW